jgi:tetratricopeptide (TPR) repeat protein
MSLFDLRASLAIGNFQQATHIAESFHPENDIEKIERDVILYRSHVELGEFNIVFEDTKSSPHIQLQAVRLYAELLSKQNYSEKVLETLESWRGQGKFDDATVQIIAALIYAKVSKIDSSFSALIPPKSLEAHSLIVNHYLSISRSDLAIRELTRMKEIQDDAIITQLARAWINVDSRDKCDDALMAFQELIEKYGQSVMLLNGYAVACIHLGNYEKAEKILLDALLLDKNSVATKINLFTCSSFLGKPKDKLTRDFNQIIQLAPDHPWVRKQQEMEQSFDKLSEIVCK